MSSIVNTVLNSTERESLEDSWRRPPLYMNYSKYINYLHEIKWNERLAHINILNLLNGPILMTVTLVGMVALTQTPFSLAVCQPSF